MNAVFARSDAAATILVSSPLTGATIRGRHLLETFIYREDYIEAQ